MITIVAMCGPVARRFEVQVNGCACGVGAADGVSVTLTLRKPDLHDLATLAGPSQLYFERTNRITKKHWSTGRHGYFKMVLISRRRDRWRAGLRMGEPADCGQPFASHLCPAQSATARSMEAICICHQRASLALEVT